MGSAGCISKESDTRHSILYLRVRTTQVKRTPTASHRAFEYSEYHPVMWTLLLIPGFLIVDSALTDPCANHTILDQAWRSIYCKWTECTGHWMCDDKLQDGWYQFKSSGGLKIPDTLIPFGYCSTSSSGWLNDPGTIPTLKPEEQSTREYDVTASSSPTESEISDPGTSPTQEPEEESTSELVGISASISGKTSSTADPGKFLIPVPREQSTTESIDISPSVSSKSSNSDPGKTPTPESEGQSTRKSSLPESSSPKGCEISDSDFKTIRVKVTSVRGLNEERARDIIMDRLQKDQCLIGLKREDIQCSGVDHPEP
ncbi:mucin-5AC-like isoform X6 [Carcharodon carcharias]|uniref:mucin-5AC-like isoform X6 n=1 Tax=Carcharodon carcharias TaxID=13397 RepID=UPI001B7E8D15|nr:mucin-5AC-like isoform X6 [Carcharodon carcharias]